MPHDVHKSLELLEEYHAELFRPSDNELKFCIEKVIGLFKTNLFGALCDIQEFYDNVLLNSNYSLAQKVCETRRFAERWERGAIRPLGAAPLGVTPVPVRTVVAAPPPVNVFSADNATNDRLASSLAKSRQILSTAELFPTISTSNSFLHTSNINRLVDEYGYEWEVEEVLVDASQVGLGFSISGGRDREPEPDYHIRITDISPGGAVAANGRLRVGDVILRVNDVDCSNVEHQVAVGALQRAGTAVRLLVKRPKVQRSQSQPRLNDQTSLRPPIEVDRQRALSGSAIDPSRQRQYPAPIQAPQSPSAAFSPAHQPAPGRAVSRLSAASNAPASAIDAPNFASKAPRLVTLFKGENGLGFNIVGGEDNEPIYVSHVLPGGSADITGNVRKGDVLLRVNDVSLQNAIHAQAAYVLKSVPQNTYVSLLLQYRPREYHDFEDKVMRLQYDLRLQQQQQQLRQQQQQQPAYL